MPETQPNPIILDTDIGDNVDDALALAFACQCPELNLVGVTTGFCDPHRRAEIALSLLDTLGFDDVRVAPGLGKPLLHSWPSRPARLHSSGYFSSRKPDRLDADAFLVKTVADILRPWKDEVETTTCMRYTAFYPAFTVCCIGPLTNLALALMKNPAWTSEIRIVLMGGMISAERPETNISADPDAARIVFDSGGDITMVGLDVTLQCQLTAEQVERIKACGHPHTTFLARMIDAWMAESNRLPVLHDPLAVAMCFDSSLCTVQRMRIGIKSSSEPPGALTVDCGFAQSGIKVCTQVDRDRFMTLFLDRICSPARLRSNRA